MMAPKVLRLRSSSQMREVNTHGAAGGRAWLNPSVCVRTIGTRCRREVNRQGSEVEIWRVTPGYGRDADRQTDRQICIYQNRDSVLQIENNYCYCPRWNAFERCSQFVLSFFYEIAVGVGGSHERDQSAPTQTVPHQVGFGSNRDCGINKVSWAPHDDGLG